MNLTHRLAAVALATVPLLTTSTPVHAIDFQFTIVGVPTPLRDSLYGRNGVAGTLRGIAFGLQDNRLDQIPTAITFLSGYEPVGLTKTTYLADDWASLPTPGFDVAGGQITDVNLRINFTDPVTGGRIFTLNNEVFGVLYNSLAWNGVPISGIDDGYRYAIGNKLGFSGVSFAAVTAVPEPSAAWLLTLGLIGLALKRQRA